MNIKEVKKQMTHFPVKKTGDAPNPVVFKRTIKKSASHSNTKSFDASEELSEITSPFDTYAQIIEGIAEFIIEGTSITLKAGDSIIIPAHKSNMIRANSHYKMIQTVIKTVTNKL
jgi:quercetin dioxygenase-like cupin family protein